MPVNELYRGALRALTESGIVRNRPPPRARAQWSGSRALQGRLARGPATCAFRSWEEDALRVGFEMGHGRRLAANGRRTASSIGAMTLLFHPPCFIAQLGFRGRRPRPHSETGSLAGGQARQGKWSGIHRVGATIKDHLGDHPSRCRGVQDAPCAMARGDIDARHRAGRSDEWNAVVCHRPVASPARSNLRVS